ncbi:Adenosine deaminase-like protein [Liparis tanakae]|uniref:Adenosine deaminase-like protein n=1 Tax=Liparis tanakae TaxID=230148 RepID=A0A4Z2IVK2_9TELE|nr:Adenosine deaminase-like protein [Liparis tanakae]
MENEADVFYRELPKVELHAHLNGSVSVHTIEKLISRKPHLHIEHGMTAIGKGQRRTLDECFQVFKVVHQLVDTEEDILMVAIDVIREFAADGVKYLELRSTPREEKKTGLTKKRYVETVIKAIKQCKNEGLDIDVRFLVAIDRRNGAEVAMETVKLAEEFMLSTDGLVLGLDLSGDPTVGHGKDLLPALQRAKDCGLKLSLHLSETDDKGVFSTDLSQEYQLAASTFGLSREAVWNLSQRAIDCIFAPDAVKQQLRQKWLSMKPQVFK